MLGDSGFEEQVARCLGNDVMENLMAWGSCETVKGDFLVSFHM